MQVKTDLFLVPLILSINNEKYMFEFNFSQPTDDIKVKFSI